MSSKATSAPADPKSHYGGAPQPEGFPGLPSDWASEWETFSVKNGASSLKLFAVDHYRKQMAPGLGHRALVILHGQGEHGGRYLHVPHYVQSEVDHVVCLDHRGHGRSEGIRGHVERFDEYVDDAAEAIHRVHDRLMERYGKAEIHVLGHSMGGLIALRLLFLHADLKVQSAIISAPLLELKMKVPLLKRVAGVGLAKVMGSLQMSTGLDFRLVSRDPAVQELYGRDRLVHDKATPKFFTGLQSAMADTIRRDVGIAVPLMAIIPLDDQIVDSQATQAFFKRLKTSVEVHAYPDFYHESLNEIGKEQVFDDLREWLKGHHL